jgi:hypothetical protein
MTPTGRSLKKLRDEGWHAYVVERWNPYGKVRQDFGGFADIIAYHPDGTITLAVQATTGGNVSARLEKLAACEAAKAWTKSYARELVVHGWALQGARGKRKVWTCRVVEV